MEEESNHAAVVRALLERARPNSSAADVTDLFEEAFGALWSRADQPLGDVTLTAITDRVLFAAAERFPMLAVLESEVGGVRCSRLRERAPTVDRDELAEALGFVLVEFLRVLGVLTAEVLTPSLHRCLAGIAPAKPGLAEEAHDEGGAHARGRDEESKP